MNPKIIKMVKRLRVDSNKDISHVLRHINLPTIENDSDNEEVADAQINSENMLLKSKITKQEAQEALEDGTVEITTFGFLAQIYKDVLNQRRLFDEEE